jgi:predicted DNA-binding protein
MYTHDMPREKVHRNFKAQTLYLTPAAVIELSALAKRTRIAKAVLLREAVDMLLRKYERG